MKILAFVDVHGNLSSIKRLVEKAKDVDLIVCAGDISNFGANLDKLILRFKKLGKPLLIIPGNHESEKQIKDAASRHSFLICLHKASFRINDFVFFGFGTGGFSSVDPELEAVIKKFKKTLRKNDKFIFVTHGPPYGTKCDFLPVSGYRGSKTKLKVVKDLKPLIHICGHLHENASKRDKIGRTIIINPGPDGRIIRVN